jgi:hypothetical protein
LPHRAGQGDLSGLTTLQHTEKKRKRLESEEELTIYVP